MADTLTQTVLYSSSDRTNSATVTDSTAMVSLFGQVYEVCPNMLNAMGSGATASNQSPAWDALYVGGRIVQDPNAAQPVAPNQVADFTQTVAINVGTATGADDTTVAAMGDIYKMAVSVQENFAGIFAAYNKLAENYSILLQYMLNYKILTSWADSGGAVTS